MENNVTEDKCRGEIIEVVQRVEQINHLKMILGFVIGIRQQEEQERHNK